RGHKEEETGRPKLETPVFLAEPEPPIGPLSSETPISSPEPVRSSGRQRSATMVSRDIFPMPEPGKPIAILKAVSGPLEGKQFLIEKQLFHIGVGQENDLRIAADDYVSENHAFLRYEQGNLFIFDKRSRNGTVVNQNQVPDSGLVLSLGDR